MDARVNSLGRGAGSQEQERTALEWLVSPRSVVIVGASDRAGSLGERTVSNLLDYSDYDGQVYFINPNKPAIRDIKCHTSVRDLPVAPDVAALVVPAKAVLATLRDCAERGVRYSLVFSSGFAELGEEGKAAQAEMARIARDSGMRIYGPNSPGFCNLNKRFGLMFSPSYRVDQRPGPIGLATQGGGIGRCFLQAMERGIGVGLWASTGNEVDLTVADFIRYMADADDIKVIAAAMEGIRDGGQLIEAARYAAERNKPVIALKIGRSEYGVQATMSHTGSISGSAAINSTVFRQVGIVEVDDIDELIDTAALFTRSRRLPAGKEKIAVFGFSGGACALTADGVGEGGLTLSTFSAKTLDTLRSALPDYAAIQNPVDATSDIITDPEVGRATLNAVADDPDVDLILYPFPCDYMEITSTIAGMVVKAQEQTEVPIVPIWLSDRLGGGFQQLAEGGLMPTRSVKQTVKAVRRWIDWGLWRSQFDATWQPLPSGGFVAQKKISHTEPAAKALLAARGVPVPAGAVARTADEAAQIAGRVGYPVVAKVVSAQITHKSDIGGVAIGLADESALRDAFARIGANARTVKDANIDGVLIEKMAPAGGFEALIGVVRDPVFGPVITFGLGGIYVELFKDVSRRKLPLTPRTARELISEPKCAKLLQGLRGKAPADLAALEKMLLSISDFVTAHASTLEELEINPVWVGQQGQGVQALDAVLVTSGAQS